MQVFVPYANCDKSARCLDNRRLNKQILEIVQILSANNNIDVGWKIPKYIKNHPCSILWKDDNEYLMTYLFCLIYEYSLRTNKAHNVFDLFFRSLYMPVHDTKNLKHLTPEFCKNMQEILLKKDYNHYSKYFIYKELK